MPVPPCGRPLTSAGTVAAARKLFIPGCSIDPTFLIAHVGLMEPERIRVAYPAALVPGPVGLHGAAVYLQPDSLCRPVTPRADPLIRTHLVTDLCSSLEGPSLVDLSFQDLGPLGAGQIALAWPSSSGSLKSGSAGLAWACMTRAPCCAQVEVRHGPD
jgi:hypothetical protein